MNPYVFWKNISDLGIDEDLDAFEKRRVVLLNQALMVVLPITLLMLGFALWTGFFTGATVILLSILLIISCLFLNYFGRFALARWLVVLGFSFYITLIIMLYGRDLGGSTSYLVVAIFTAVGFRHKRNKLIIYLLLGFCILGTELYMNYFSAPYASYISRMAYTGSLIANFLTVIALLAFVTYDQRKFVGETEELLNNLKDKNIELEQKNQQIAVQNDQLTRLNEELEQFAYACSHHFKTPLRSIHSFLGLIENELSHQQLGKVEEYISFAKESSTHMYTLTQDLLNFSRLTISGESKSWVSLDRVAKDIERNLHEKLSQSAATLQVEKLPQVYGHEFHFQLLFQNLIENGLTYNTSPQPSIRLHSKVSAGSLFFFIEDNGIGIPSAYRERIFSMFNRLHSPEEFEGTGLGLTICQKIMEKYEGKLGIAGSSEQGTTFQLEFPLSILSPDSQASA